MTDIAIRVENLSKQYRIGARQEHYRTLRDTVTHAMQAPLRRLKWISKSEFRNAQSNHSQAEARDSPFIWALKNVSFEVKRGEVVGIIGPNGAGKTTLLKILSRVTEPTEGRAELLGRVGSLLEVGTGFHPELTGRENIYLSGAILGMRKAEIDRKFDEIVAFAETEKFLDTPMKHYSSGMYVRLAFAVAAHLEPEILLVDEVLAVGDAAFQKKCLGKMGDVAKEGRTVLFVSHNMVALQSLCGRAIWLNAGEIVEEGQSGQVISNYLKTNLSPVMEQLWDDMDLAPGNDKVRLHRVCVQLEDGSPDDLVTIHSPIVVQVEYWNLVPGARLHITLHVLNEQQIIAFTTGSFLAADQWASRPSPVGLFRSTCHIPGDLLNSGMYRVRVLVVQNGATVIYRLNDAISFDVHDLDERGMAWFGREPGVMLPRLEWSTGYLGEARDGEQA